MTNLTTWIAFIAVCFVPALALSWSVTWLMRKLAPRWGLVDHPASRKVHTTPTPMGGGIGIYCGFVLPVVATLAVAWMADPGKLAFVPEEWRVHLPGALSRATQLGCILVAGTLLAVMGLLDDLRGLPWTWRLLVQVLIAWGLTLAGVRGSVFVPYPIVGTILSVIWIVVLINAFNFLDNMDALSAGIGFIAAVLFAIVMLISERWLVGGCLLVLAGSLLGFLWHNRPPARIFMGDAGSTFLGLMLACLTLVGTFYDPETNRQHVILAPVCVLAVPLYDFSSVILIRLIHGRSPFHPDKNHFSHRLVELGLSPRYAVMTVHLCTLTTGLGALILYLPDVSDAVLVGALVLCILSIIAILETAGRRKRP